jgi:hypothetical protein
MLNTESLQKLLDELRTQRDELKLKLHLAKADARDEFAELEKKFEQLRSKVAAAGADAGEAGGRIAEELRKGYERVRSRF